MTTTTVILARNAENDIEKCLQSVSWSDEILVIDDNSTDKTVMLAIKFGAKVIKHALEEDFSMQRNFALEHAKGDWVLFVDSDEVVSASLQEEIQEITSDTKTAKKGYFIKRRDVLWGKEIKHGESGNIQLIRFAQRNAGKWEGKVHEKWHIRGSIGLLRQFLYHYPHQNLSEFLQEINWYTDLRAKELYQKGVIVNWCHILLYPKVKFLQNYIVKGGFLDGTIGFITAILMSLHSFLVRGKLWQLQKNK